MNESMSPVDGDKNGEKGESETANVKRMNREEKRVKRIWRTLDMDVGSIWGSLCLAWRVITAVKVSPVSLHPSK